MRAPSSIERLLLVVPVGVIAGLATALVAPWQLAVIAGWDATAATFVVWVWAGIARFTDEETRRLATREDSSRVVASVLLLSASVASLAGTGFDLVKADQAHGVGRVVLTTAGVVTVGLSWTLVHTVFTLRYAHEFYTEPVGGIDFKTRDELPDYRDFAYVAFTVGMTFQVSDTDIQARRIRHTVLRQALLAYLFGAVILAVVVNVIATLLNR